MEVKEVFAARIKLAVEVEGFFALIGIAKIRWAKAYALIKGVIL